MRYGLPREERPNLKKKWRNAVENELKSLKMEVCILREQLDEATKKLSEFSSSKPPDPFAFIKGFSRKENPFPDSPFASTGERPRYDSFWDYDVQSKRALRYDSITCMPNYVKDEKSFEELRQEDYVLKGIGFSNQIQRYKDAELRSLRTERNIFTFSPKNWKPVERNSQAGPNDGGPQSSFIIPWYLTPKAPKAPWPFGPPTAVRSDLCSSKSHLSATNKIPGSSGVMKDSKCETAQNKPATTFSFKGKIKTKMCSEVGTLTEDEHFSSQLLSEIKKMGEKMSSISDQLLKMDSNISDVSTRVSVMDSRLSAVDMFITMQRFDKKWQGLETRLAGLETPSLTEFVPSPKEERTSEGTQKGDDIHLQTCTTFEEGISENKADKSSSEPVNETPFPLKVEKSPITTQKNNFGESSHIMVTSDTNLSDFVRSISCNDVTMDGKRLYSFSSLDNSSLSDYSSNMNHDSGTIEMTDFKSHSLPSEPFFMGNLSTEKNSSKISSSETLALTSAKISHGRKRSSDEPLGTSLIMCNETEEKKLEQEPEQGNSCEKDDNTEKVSNDPLGVSEKRHSPMNPSCSNKMVVNEEFENDEEFVIVEKSDVDETFGEGSNTDTMVSSNENEPHSHDVSTKSEFKMYNDITEYLEINLGKKKNLVYEFGFEAKPDCVLDSEEQSVETQVSKAESSSKEDSFHFFKTNFIANQSVDTKQSSPMVLFDPKNPLELPVHNNPCIRKAIRRTRMKCKSVM